MSSFKQTHGTRLVHIDKASPSLIRDFRHKDASIHLYSRRYTAAHLAYLHFVNNNSSNSNSNIYGQRGISYHVHAMFSPEPKHWNGQEMPKP
jgi:hypothetical protein